MFHPRGAGTLFNWFTTLTFAAALLFWLLAAYVLTRGRRDAVSTAAFVALASTAAYLLGEGMEANAPSPEAWQQWARGLRWGAPLSAAGWYWLTALFLREAGAPVVRGYLRWVGYPFGFALLLFGVFFTAAVYVDDWLWEWSAEPHDEGDAASYLRYYAPAGEFYPAFMQYVAVAVLGAAVNLALARWAPRPEDRHRRFSWLLLSLALFIPEEGSTIAYHWFTVALPTWFNHLCLAAAMVLMATSVAEYHHLRHGQTIRADLLYYVAAWAAGCAVAAPIFLAVGGGYSFPLLGLLVLTLATIILAHALGDPIRRVLDRLFFGSDVQRLRSSLSTVVQDAALTQDHNFGALLSQAQTELREVSIEHQARLTQEALRRLNAPAGLADCALAEQLPRTLAAMLRGDPAANGAGQAKVSEPTPLERARALRAALIQAIERLKPADDGDPGAPTALQYHILHEAYVLGRPNKQIMVRRGISESTFHRNRRDAISVLSRELARREERLASE
jgi:hypothetical protein